jgi:hypothetical protein
MHPFYGLHTLRNKRLRDFAHASTPVAFVDSERSDFFSAWRSLVDESFPDLRSELGERHRGCDSLIAAHTGFGSPLLRARVIEKASGAGGVVVQLPASCGGLTQFAMILRAEREGFITISIDVPPSWVSQNFELLCQFSLSVPGVAHLGGGDKSRLSEHW